MTRAYYFAEKNIQAVANLEHRLMSKVKKTKKCWIWQGAHTIYGQGLLTSINGSSRLASRVSWTIFKGSIPKKSLVLHDCDNKRCVNPNHLHLGNHSQNIKEAWDRGLRQHSIYWDGKITCPKKGRTK